MAKAKKTAKTTPKRLAAKAAAKQKAAPRPRTSPRRIKQGQYKSLRLQKRIKHPVQLPNIWRLTRAAALTLWQHKKLFIGITLIYGLLNVVLAQGLAGGSNVSTLKSTLDEVFTGHFGAVASSLTIFVSLVGSAGNTTNQVAGAYQVFLALVGSLAIIWTLRQVAAGTVPRIRDAYYRGMAPLVTFLLVLLVIALQVIPLILGSMLYSLVVSNGIAVYFVEKLLWALLYGMLALCSLYMLSSSLFALYIVTLPNMAPMQALRSARELVRFRRWTVLRKVLCLPLILLLAAAVVMLPIIILAAPFAQYVFFLLTMFALVAVHTYMYTLYRELLNE